MWLFVCFFPLLLAYLCRYQTPCCCLISVVALGGYLGVCLWIGKSIGWGCICVSCLGLEMLDCIWCVCIWLCCYDRVCGWFGRGLWDVCLLVYVDIGL